MLQKLLSFWHSCCYVLGTLILASPLQFIVIVVCSILPLVPLKQAKPLSIVSFPNCHEYLVAGGLGNLTSYAYPFHIYHNFLCCNLTLFIFFDSDSQKQPKPTRVPLLGFFGCGKSPLFNFLSYVFFTTSILFCNTLLYSCFCFLFTFLSRCLFTFFYYTFSYLKSFNMFHFISF